MNRYHFTESAGLTRQRDGELVYLRDANKAIETYCRERLRDLKQRRDAADTHRQKDHRAGLNEAIQEIQRWQHDLASVIPRDETNHPAYEEPARTGRDVCDPHAQACE